MKDNSLIIIPTYNEAENIKAVINKIFSLNDYNSILVVDDNSPDRTSNIVRNLKKNYDKNIIRILINYKKKLLIILFNNKNLLSSFKFLY